MTDPSITPWSFLPAQGTSCACIYDAEGKQIALVTNIVDARQYDRENADAALMTSAPRLLADLIAVVGLCESLIHQIHPTDLERILKRILTEHGANPVDYILNMARSDIAEVSNP